MSGMRPLRIAAWCAALANVLFLAIAVIRTPAGDWLPAWFVPFVGAAFVAPSIVGLLIANRQPRNVIAWIMLLGPLPLTIQAPLDLVLGEGWALQIDRATWPLLYAWPIAVAYVFPTGRLLSKRWRWMVAYAVTSFVCFTAIALLDPEPFYGEDAKTPNPLADNAVAEWIDNAGLSWVWVVFWAGILASLIGGSVAMVLRLRRSRGIERLQSMWLAWSAVLIPLGATGSPSLTCRSVRRRFYPSGLGDTCNATFDEMDSAATWRSGQPTGGPLRHTIDSRKNNRLLQQQLHRRQHAAGNTAVTLESVNAKADAAALAGHNAWMLTSSALVLFMTAPGLAMFYGGLVRKKNVLSVMMQCLFLMGLMTVIWGLYGYSLAFGDPDNQRRLNRTSATATYLFMKDVARTLAGRRHRRRSSRRSAPRVAIPRLTHMLFQGMFFIITPGLICGAFAERMKFSAMAVFCAFCGARSFICPLCHWVWGGGMLAYVPVAGVDAIDGRRARLRRRHGRAHQLRRLGAGLRAGDRQAARLRPRRHAAAQPDLHGARRRDAVGRLVRLQRRQRAGVRRPGRQRVLRDALRGRRRRSRLGLSTSGSRAASRPCSARPRASLPGWCASRRPPAS